LQCFRADNFRGKNGVTLNARLVVSGLWAVGAILWASTGLYGEKGRPLNFTGIEGRAVGSLRLIEEVWEGLGVDGGSFLASPVVTDGNCFVGHTHSFTNLRVT
jgi:hypothetical protein